MTISPAHNIGLAIWRLMCFYETIVQGSTFGILLNFSTKNPPHRQAENRYQLLSWAQILAVGLVTLSKSANDFSRRL